MCDYTSLKRRRKKFCTGRVWIRDFINFSSSYIYRVSLPPEILFTLNIVGELAGRPSTQRGTVQIYDFCQVQSIYFTKSFKPSKISVTNLENPGLLWRGCFTIFTKSLYFLNKTRNTSHLKKIIIPKKFIGNQKKNIANRLFVSFVFRI